jgi:hypothetical protein
MPGIFLPPAAAGPTMVITSIAGDPAPVLLGRFTLAKAGFTWTEAENAAVRDLPADFGPRNASPLVTAFPTRIDQFVETANTFNTVSDAERWFASWPGVSSLSPQMLDPGAIRAANPDVAPLTWADEALVTDWTLAEFDIPSDIQYLMRIGSTVISLELIGGNELTNASTISLARRALTTVVRACDPT